MNESSITEEKLRESEQRFREVLENSIAACYKRSLITNTYDYLSPVFKKIAGYSQGGNEQPSLDAVIAMIHPHDMNAVTVGITRAISDLDGLPHIVEYRFKHKTDQEFRWLQDEFVVMQDESGQPVALIGSVSDISERKQAEALIKEQANRYKSIITVSNTGAWEYHAVSDFLWCSPEYFSMLGRDAADYNPASDKTLEEAWTDLLHPDDKVQATDFFSTYLENGSVGMYENYFRLLHKNGSWVWIWSRGQTLRDEEGCLTGITVGTHIDITARKLSEEALQKSEANLFTIFDTTDTIYILLDNKFQVLSFNKQANDFVKKELNGELRLSANLVNYFPQQRQPELYQRMREVLSGISTSYESSYAQKNGFTNWYHVRMFPISNNTEKVFGLMVAVSNVTEKKMLEQEIISQEIEEQRKMTRAVLNAQEKERNKIGQELHDNVIQLLAGSKIMLGLLNKKTMGGEEMVTKSLKLVDEAMNEIISLTRQQVAPQQKIDLEELLRSLIDYLDNNSTIQTKYAFNPGTLIIKDDLKLNVYRIVQEAINNIVKHAEAKKVEILISTQEEDALKIVISDDGKGFELATAKNKGIGIVNIVNRVESYNGHISIYSNNGSGCTIEIIIPV